jgi:hypothetical protein
MIAWRMMTTTIPPVTVTVGEKETGREVRNRGHPDDTPAVIVVGGK